MTELYYIDDLPAFATWGFVVSKGSDTFLQPNERKEPEAYDWKDENGIEYDLSNPVFKPRTFILEGVIVGDNELDFKIKFNAFTTQLGLAGSRKIEALEIGATVYAFCSKWQQTERMTRMQGGGKVYAKIAVTLNEVVGAFLNTLTIDSTI